MEKVYSRNLDVAYYLTDHRSQLKPSNILRILTDLSLYQGNEVDPRLDTDFDFFWVLYRWHIEIKRLPMTHETIKASTWAKSFKKFYANRGFSMETIDGEVLLEAETTWFMLNQKTNRLARFPENIDEEYGNSQKGIEAGKKVLREVKNPTIEKSLKVENSNLDLNSHVNNAVYVDWIFNSLDMDFLESHRLEVMDIIYKKELTLGQEVQLVMEINELEEGFDLVANVRDEKNIFTYIYLVFK